VAAKKTSRAARKANRARTADGLLVSVYTPTDNAKYLKECYKSLRAQRYKNWEWILVTNGELLKSSTIPKQIRDDEAVRICSYPFPSRGIGALKGYAIQQCQGQLYVELDHDDILTPDALEEIVCAYNKTNAGFFYSDFVTFREDKTSVTYPAEVGWESYAVKRGATSYQASRAFLPSAASIHRLIFCPNHIRAWSKEGYEAAGGYDSEFMVCDDFDLITRTYLAGVEFHYIDKCLYFYRNWEGSRSLAHNQDIQKIEGDLAHTRAHDIAREHCRRRGLLAVEVGFGPDLIPPSDFTDIEDDSLGWVRVKDVIQYIPAGYVVEWMTTVWRKLAHESWLALSVPSTDGPGGFQNPTYSSFWNLHSFYYFTDDWYSSQLVGGFSGNFHLARCWDDYPDEFLESRKILYANADLIALKDDNARVAGVPLPKKKKRRRTKDGSKRPNAAVGDRSLRR